MVTVWPHLTLPSSGSSSPMRILNIVVCASSFSPTKAILSFLPTMKETLSRSFTPSMVFDTSVTNRISLPTSRSRSKPTNGYRREDAGISSTESLSRSRRRDVACLLLALLAAKRAMKVWSSAIFSSLRLFLLRMSCWMSCEDSYQKS